MRSYVVKPLVFVPLLLLLFGSTVVFASAKGQVTGQIIDSGNNIKLMGVLVTSPGQSQKAVSTRQGEYSLSLPAGQHSLTFSYLGYQPITRDVTITDNTTTSLNIDFGADTVALDEVVVQGQAVGQARALNRQMTAPNLKNVVASDAFGRFPDQNAAEALDRLPGVSLERDQGEGRFVIIRGIDPHLNSVSIDGVAMAAAEDSTRAVLLDVIPMNVMETLEVTKALTADMPADSIGGHINIETPSAFDHNERIVKGMVGGNYSDLTEDWAPSAQLAFGDTFGEKNQFGFLGSISYDRREYGSINVEADPWEKDDDGHWVTEELQYRDYELTRERLSATANLEWKPTDTDLFFLRGIYSEFTDHERRRRTVIKDAAMLSATDSSGLIVNEDDDAAAPTTTAELKDREETQLNWSLSTGGKHKFDSWDVDYSAAYSYAEQDTPDDTEITYENETLSYAYRQSGSYTPSVTVVSGDQYDLSNYEFDEVEDAEQMVREKAWIFQTNVKKNLDIPWQTYLKGGVYVSLRNKTNDLEVWKSDDNPASFDTLEGNSGSGHYAYADFPLLSSYLVNHFRNQKSAFAMERDLVDSEAEDFETDEDIYAAYLLANVDFGKVSIMPGVRYEYTDLEATGNIVDEDLEEVLGTQTKSRTYDNILPSVHVRATLLDNLIARASWTNSLSRPNWDQTRYSQVTDDDGNVEVGNPDLDPYEAMNWDASLAYYAPRLGMASVGFFYKDIDNFIYSRTSYNADDDYDVTTWQNGDSGYIYGFELAGQLELVSLTPVLEGFSVLANITFSDSEADVLDSEGENPRTVDFVRNSDTVGSVGLSYEKHGFFIRLSGTYRSSYLDELGDESSEDRYIDDHFQIDLSTAYTFNKKYTLFANFINLTDEPLKAYWGESGGLSQYEKYGWSARIGLKFSL